MSTAAVATLVMLNNYFHDLAVAVFFCSVLTGWIVFRTLRGEDGRTKAGPVETRIWRGLSKAVWGSLAWILIGGIIRALSYHDYEWLPAAGRDQVAALIIKHVLLGGMTAFGIYLYLKISRRVSQADDKKSGGGSGHEAGRQTL